MLCRRFSASSRRSPLTNSTPSSRLSLPALDSLGTRRYHSGNEPPNSTSCRPAVGTLRFRALLLVAVIVWAMVLVRVLNVTSGNIWLSGEAQTAAAGLIRIQREWEARQTNGYYPAFFHPANLQVNSLDFGRLSAGWAKKHIGPLGMWWSKGYQIQRANVNDTVWILYRVHSFGIPNTKGITWRSKLTTVTNCP